MFDKLEVHNYRRFRDLTLELHPRLTLLVGQNGEGKSTLLNALRTCLVGAARHGRTHAPTPLDVSDGTEKLFLRLTATSDSAHPWAVNFTQTRSAERHHWHKDNGLMEPPPFLLRFFPARPGRETRLVTPTTAENAALVGLDSYDPAPGAVAWFTEHENFENERRLRTDPDFRDSALSLVRDTLARFWSGLGHEGVGDPYISRTRIRGPFAAPGASDAALVLHWEGNERQLSQLSDGQRRVLLMVMDIALRLTILGPESNGVVLIDEVELHLHPRWQRRILPALLETFPTLQFVATTHSPQVVGSVEAECVRVLRDGGVHASAPTMGRDSNTLLLSPFDAEMRDPETQREIDAIDALIDADRLEEAQASLDRLRARLGDDTELDRLETVLRFAAS